MSQRSTKTHPAVTAALWAANTILAVGWAVVIVAADRVTWNPPTIIMFTVAATVTARYLRAAGFTFDPYRIDT